MTPAINQAKKSKLSFNVHEYAHDASCQAYGLEAAEKLGVAEQQVFKTLVVLLASNELAVAVVPVANMLNFKSIAKAAGTKKAGMADGNLVEKTTGYVLGGVSPLGQKKRLKTYIDASAKNHKTIFVSAGRRGLEIELAPDDLLSLTQGRYIDLCR